MEPNLGLDIAMEYFLTSPLADAELDPVPREVLVVKRHWPQ